MIEAQPLLAARYRLAQHYLNKLRVAQRVYQQGNDNEARALALFDQERDQIRHWRAWTSVDSGQSEQARTFCRDYVEASPDIFELRLSPREYLTWLEDAVQAARHLGDQRAEAACLLQMWEISVLALAYQDAIDHTQQALTIARRIGDRQLIARALRVCGDVATFKGNLEEAQGYYDQSYALSRAIGDRKGRAKVLEALSVLALSRRESAAAQNYLEQCLALNREIGHLVGIEICLNDLGYLAIRLENYSAARQYLEQALELSQLLEDRLNMPPILSNLGTIAYWQGMYALALNYFERAMSIARAIGVKELEAIDLHKSGLAAMAQGDLLKTREYFERSLALSRSIPPGTLLPSTLGHLALIYQRLQQKVLASTILREGLETVREMPDSFAPARLAVLIAAARIWILRGMPFQAALWLSLVENDPHPSARTTYIEQDLQEGLAECQAALPPEQFVSAWKQGKVLNQETVIEEILSELAARSGLESNNVLPEI